MKFSHARKRKTFCLLLCTLVGLLFCAQVTLGQGNLEQLEQDALYAAAVEAAPYVVKVECIGGSERVGEQLISSAPTSGVIVGPDGFIACSAYAFAKKPTSILVELPDGRRQAAELVAEDHRYGLVLLKVDVDRPLDVPVPANSSSVQVGQWAITVARTLPGNDFNMSVGIVSATGRVWGKAIQIDANVSPANYGGALVGIDGRIAGILVPRSPNSDDVMAGTEWYDSGIGFAIPLDRVLEQLEQWKEGDLQPGKIGIAMKSENLYGAMPVIGVCRPNSPARDADIRKGDTVVAANGLPVASYAQLKHILGPMLAGDVLELEVLRGEENLKKSLVLTDKLKPYEHAFFGILPGEVRGDEPGVPVRWVYPASPAEKAEIRPGDRLTQLNGEPVADEATLRQALAELETGQEIEIVAVRDGEARTPAKTTLVTDVEEVPSSLPQRYEGLESGAEGLPPLGKITIKLPEEVNDCEAFIPETYDPQRTHGLLVVLPGPGDKEIAELIRSWRDLCNESRTILLVPQARDEQSWEKSETQFIRKTIDNLRNDYQVDEDRIALFGAENSGAMAYLTGFTYRDLVRGIAVVDAGIPRSSPPLFNEPLQRLSIWVASPQEGRMAERIEGNVTLLRKLKFPVTQTKLELGDSEPDSAKVTDATRESVMRWLDTLDRL